ncbi:hypothetical protein E1263_05480 [Kribbella antibiotica]|uniref:Uncharacterized protein n=1 Tax=Kribbella antibiotica TaxID=190195 RepID=A0A4R4ZSN9_9ACTN|nr:hypothetical protein [Kribbella antibiotica]TDD62063.1 hypothetical protein E1263_05480 [Kribbella antibiotica]
MADFGFVPPNHRVRVWFGEHPIATFIGPKESAASYETGMQQRFASLRITNEPAPAVVDSNAADS